MAIGKRPCPECHGPMHRGYPRCALCRNKRLIVEKAAVPAPPLEQLRADRTAQRSVAEIASLKARYQESLKVIERLEQELQAVGVLSQSLATTVIEPHYGHRTSEGTVVLVASDWHIEETVGAEVGGLNVFNLDIAQQRATRFFQSALRLLRLLQQDITIQTVVLALLGDFISNDIHEEFPELNDLQPTHALVLAQNLLASGIESLLAESTLNLVIPCHSGNHARTTRTTRFGAENGHSLEYLMYLHLAAYFRHEPRVRFIIADGIHSYVQIYDQTVRFQHGHAIKYGGGVGGVYIPLNKAINQYNKARHADLDVLGHFHQQRDGGNFLINGSLIGFNAFALSIRADFEKPRQLLFLLDKKRGRTCTWPILVDSE